MAHIHEKIDFTASVFIVHDNRVLLHKHKKTGLWLQFGGHVELDEDPNQAAIREAKEESGFDIELVGRTSRNEWVDSSVDLVVPISVNRHYFDTTKSHEHIDFSYYGRIRGGEQLEDAGTEMRWLSREEIEHDAIPLLPNIKARALDALSVLSK